MVYHRFSCRLCICAKSMRALIKKLIEQEYKDNEQIEGLDIPKWINKELANFRVHMGGKELLDFFFVTTVIDGVIHIEARTILIKEGEQIQAIFNDNAFKANRLYNQEQITDIFLKLDEYAKHLKTKWE